MKYEHENDLEYILIQLWKVLQCISSSTMAVSFIFFDSPHTVAVDLKKAAEHTITTCTHTRTHTETVHTHIALPKRINPFIAFIGGDVKQFFGLGKHSYLSHVYIAKTTFNKNSLNQKKMKPILPSVAPFKCKFLHSCEFCPQCASLNVCLVMLCFFDILFYLFCFLVN